MIRKPILKKYHILFKIKIVACFSPCIFKTNRMHLSKLSINMFSRALLSILSTVLSFCTSCKLNSVMHCTCIIIMLQKSAYLHQNIYMLYKQPTKIE